MHILSCLITLALLSLAQSAQAQSNGTPSPASPSTIDGSERHTLRASRTGIPYQIDIVRVESTLIPVPADYRLPVIYVLDGNGLFPLAAHIASSTVAFSNRLPAVLVVAIGYPADSSLSRAENLRYRLAARTRDFTPTAIAGQAGSGAAAQFLAFIEQDLKPFVAARHRVDPSDQTLTGHSFGGLFAAWTLLNSPDAFSRYVLSSPSLFWDDRTVIRQATTFAGRRSGAPRVFISVGEFETKERAGEDMIVVARAFADVLQQRTTAGVDMDVSLTFFPGEGHLSIVPGAMMRGLTQVGALR